MEERPMTHEERVKAYTRGKTPGRGMTDEERKAFWTFIQRQTDEARRTGDWSTLLGPESDTPELIL